MAHICKNLVGALKYLQEQGFNQDQLSRVHHFSLNDRGVTFRSTIKYFDDEKNLRKRNYDFANRVIYVAEGYRSKKASFSTLISEALIKHPLQ